MSKAKNVLISAAIVLIVVAVLLISLVTAFAAGAIGGFPKWRADLFRYYYKVTSLNSNKSALRGMHQATKVLKSGSYTYDYTVEDKKIVERDSAKCVACHGKMTELNKDKKPKYLIHWKMLTIPMLKLQCTECHKQVDTRKRGPGQMRMVKIDRSFCPKCHNQQSISKSEVKSDWRHFFSEKRIKAAEQAAQLPSAIQLHVIKGNDGGKTWISQHSVVAKDIGVDQCRKCHIPNSELDICNTCHTEHPHNQTWINGRHGKKARKDFSYCMDCHIEGNKCYSCHKVKVPHDVTTKAKTENWDKIHYLEKDRSLCLRCHKDNAPPPNATEAQDPDFCQKCHHRQFIQAAKDLGVDYSQLRWKKIHFRVVKENGAQECFQCHNVIYCSRCHIKGKKPIPKSGLIKFNKDIWNHDYDGWLK